MHPMHSDALLLRITPLVSSARVFRARILLCIIRICGRTTVTVVTSSSKPAGIGPFAKFTRVRKVTQCFLFFLIAAFSHSKPRGRVGKKKPAATADSTHSSEMFLQNHDFSTAQQLLKEPSPLLPCPIQSSVRANANASACVVTFPSALASWIASSNCPIVGLGES